MAWNITDNWQIAKILTDNWHLYHPIQIFLNANHDLTAKRRAIKAECN